MTAKPTIIRADLEHLQILAPLFDAYRVFYEQASDLAGAREYLQQRLSNLDSVIFLALDGRRGLGFCQLYPSFTSVRMRRIWILYDLFVIREARRQGIGRALMERVRKLETHFDQADRDIKDIRISANKISSRGTKIEELELDERPGPPGLGISDTFDFDE